MNVIDYITITCNLKKCPITDYIRLHDKCNRLQPITITNYDYPMSEQDIITLYPITERCIMFRVMKIS